MTFSQGKLMGLFCFLNIKNFVWLVSDGNAPSLCRNLASNSKHRLVLRTRRATVSKALRGFDCNGFMLGQR